MTVVSLLLEEIPHYRVAFLHRLHARLRSDGVTLQVHFGRSAQSNERELAEAAWARRVPIVSGRILNLDYVWQPVLGELAHDELVIVEQANRHLVNYVLHARRMLGRQKFAYWGHGRNLQSSAPGGLRERLKVALLRHVDWWFAYTNATRRYLLARGYPEECITVVNNSQDGAAMKAGLLACRERGRQSVRESLQCGSGPVALYCGRLHDLKRIDFLLEAALRLRALLPEFELLIVGDGPRRDVVEEISQRHSWIRNAGTVVGEQLAQYWYAADVALMPGAVGLALVDSFIAECPLVTMRSDFHGPEFAYLESGRNGIATADSLEDYVAEVAALLCNKSKLQRLQAGCRDGAERYSLDRMTANFANGAIACLKATSRTRAGLAHR